MSTIDVCIYNNLKNGHTWTRIREIDDFFIKRHDFKDYDYD